MMPVKQVLKAALVQDIQFRSAEYFDLYLEAMGGRCVQVLDRFDRYDGSLIVRVVLSYGLHPLLTISEVI